MKFTTAQLEAFIDAMLVLENDIARINNEIALNRFSPDHMAFVDEVLARKQRHLEVFSQMVQSQ
jgi:glycine cleavage system protein P-like pyridoxal-binding family